MAHMGVNYHNQYLSLSFYYSDETEEMAVDDIPVDILDQEDTELSPLLSQPIVPVTINYPPTQFRQPRMSAYEILTTTVQSLPSAMHHVPAAPPQASAAPPLVSIAPPMVSAAMVSAAPPMVSAAPPVVSAAPPLVSAALPLVSAAPPLVLAAAPLVSAAPPLVSAAPPLVSAAPPLVSAAPPQVLAAPPQVSAINQPPPTYPPPLMQNMSHLQQRANHQRGNSRQRHNHTRATNYQQMKRGRGRGGRGYHGVKHNNFKRVTQQSQEMDQRKLKHALENLLADELMVKPSNPSTLELLVSEFKPI